ncbi:N-lysine methyltransferase SMYD2 [Phytophthora nicotianae]|uniref:N-lysine methyltransferase SMYD2 n=1 Tax=Phytophthora nicotianae TaxID=4792 RepID=A0A0W8CMH5_PHYNI|nr:N-lysine methyltransferase SMYD2 [Phytophthora nicotianae]
MRIVSDRAVDASSDVSGDRGRRVETQSDLDAGDLALRASVSAAVLLPELWSSHCHKCFATGVRLSRCGRCNTAFYCSKACQQADWVPDHRKECKSLAQLAQLGLRSDQVADVLLLGRVLRRESGEGLLPSELVWYEEDMDDQELLLLAALAQKINLVDGKENEEEEGMWLLATVSYVGVVAAESFSMDEMQCIDALQKLAEQQSIILHHDSIARLQTLATLFSAEMERGSVEEAIGYGERMLEFYRRVYNSNHPMTGLHLFTLGDLYGQQAQAGTGAEESKQKSLEYLTEAQRILRITHGKDHRFVKMLSDRLEKVSA